MYVICWQINGGENWADYRGGTIRDTNTFLTEDNYVSGPKNAKSFDSVPEAIEFGKKWMKEQNQDKSIPVQSEDGNKTILDYGSDSEAFGNTRLVIRPYRPRNV